jgi:hypothetical protein
MPLAMPPSLICSKDLGLWTVFRAHSPCSIPLPIFASPNTLVFGCELTEIREFRVFQMLLRRFLAHRNLRKQICLVATAPGPVMPFAELVVRFSSN